MQTRESTWIHTTRNLFGQARPFGQAFDPRINREVGKSYLAELQTFLLRYKKQWISDERNLLLGCYNAGPEAVRRARFDVNNLSSGTRDYIKRIIALHNLYLNTVLSGFLRKCLRG